MHFLPNTLNSHQFFKLFPELLTKKEFPEDAKRKIYRFLYRTSCLLTSRESIYHSEATTVNLINQYDKQFTFAEGTKKRFSVSVETLFNIYSQIPTCLSNLVQMQDLIVPILKDIYQLKFSSPTSFRKAMNNIDNYGFNDAVKTELKKYWKEYGEYLRNVRDVNEHFDALVDQTFFDQESKPGQILIFLPDNPEIKSSKKFTYEKEIDAHLTIMKNVESLNEIFNVVMNDLGINQGQYTRTHEMGQMGTFEKPMNRTLGLMISITNTESGQKLSLDTIEFKQIIPKDKKSGNIELRKMVPDHELK